MTERLVGALAGVAGVALIGLSFAINGAPPEGTASDPDGNDVVVRWWRWKDVDTDPGEVRLSNPTALATRLQVPADAAPGQTILTQYARVVVFVTP